MNSDFMTGSPLQARWMYIEGDFRNVCTTQGASFTNRLKATLGLQTGGAWNDAVQAQLIAVVNGLFASDSSWQTVLAYLRQDATDRVVREMSARTAVWLTYYRASGRRFDGIQFFPGTVFPQWGQLPANDRGYNGGRIVCYDEAVDTDPMLVSGNQLATQTANSATGVRLEPGRLPPQSSISVILGGQQTVSPLTVVAISVLLLGIGALIVRSTR